MIEVWDYFMRRKGLLLLVLAVFMASSILSFQALRSSATEEELEYISIAHWGSEEVEIPRTGSTEAFSVMEPRELANLAEQSNNPDNSAGIGTEFSGLSDLPELPEQDLATQIALEDTGAEPEVTPAEAVPPVEPEPIDDPIAVELSENNLTENLDSEKIVEGDPEPEESIDRLLEDGESANHAPGEASDLLTNQDIDEVKPAPAQKSENQSYIIFLTIIGIIASAALVYFAEQHFLR